MGVTVIAKARYLRIAPQKMWGIASLVRGKKIQAAIDILTFCRRRGAGPVLKAIKSAVANADQKGGIDLDTLYVKAISIGQGPTLKRFRPRSRGMASPILKRTSHISVELAEK